MTKQEVTALRPFWDGEGGKYIKAGETVEVSEVRAGELTRSGLAQKAAAKPAAKAADSDPPAPPAPKPATPKTAPKPAAKTAAK